MKAHHIKPMQDSHVNVTPLIDIIMCLIIFFLLVGHIAKAASIKGIKIPAAKNGRDLRDKSNQLIINLVPPTGGYGDNASPAIWIWSNRIPESQLAHYLHKQKHDNPAIKVVLRADRSIPYKFVAPVLISCAQAGIASIHFMTRRAN
jgi:biopolymer transport protein ExbD